MQQLTREETFAIGPLCLDLNKSPDIRFYTARRSSNLARVFGVDLTFGVDLQRDYSLSFPMAVASYHGIRSGEVELGVGYLQPILWPRAHQPEVRRVPVIVGLQDGNRVRASQVASIQRGMFTASYRRVYVCLATRASWIADNTRDNFPAASNCRESAREHR